MNLARLATRHLRALYRIAKHPTRGAYPFFRDPKAMIALRREMERRDEHQTSHDPAR